jgi:hypothetical protein
MGTVTTFLRPVIHGLVVDDAEVGFLCIRRVTLVLFMFEQENSRK